MSTTNGSLAAPSRDEVLRLSTYYAAVEGYFDTSEAAQKRGLLTISVMDMVYSGRPLPAGANYQFYVMIDRTGWIVTYYQPDRYEVTPHDQTEHDKTERELREAVLDAALWHLTGEGAGYHVGAGEEARKAAIKELLEEGPDEKQREEADPHAHPVVRDVLPDPTISLAPGGEGGKPPQVLRQWEVEIGPYHSCTVCFFGYDAEDHSPVLVPMEAEEETDDYDEEEGEE